MIDGSRIKKLVIVGGGTAGWMAAASLKHHFQNTPLEIILIESSEIGTVGVGEATIPTIRRFYAQLGMKDAEVMQATEATCKLGIRFNGWGGEGGSFVHPFGLFGQDFRGIGFHHYWMKLRSLGLETPLQDYSLGASLAEAERFSVPPPNPASQVSVYDWALHLDAGLFARHLRGFAERAGCRRVDARIKSVRLRPEDGFIAAVVLDTGEEIEGDLFIDCSGFRGLLIGETLGVGYEDWGHWLLCDSAFAVQGKTTRLPPYTSVTARSAGWQWHIPLRHRSGNGMVFSSRHISDEVAVAELLANMDGEPLFEPRRIGFRPGRRAVAWERNCIALGLASGFLEPLESTSIALIETAIERVKQLFPDTGFDPASIAEFNRVTTLEMERVRDFLILHYKLNRREGPFWRECREMVVPEGLAHKMSLFESRGHFVKYSWEMFSPASWLAIYSGFDFLPRGYDPAVDAIDPDYLGRVFQEMRDSIGQAVAATPRHGEFLAILDRTSGATARVQEAARA